MVVKLLMSKIISILQTVTVLKTYQMQGGDQIALSFVLYGLTTVKLWTILRRFWNVNIILRDSGPLWERYLISVFNFCLLFRLENNKRFPCHGLWFGLSEWFRLLVWQNKLKLSTEVFIAGCKMLMLTARGL